MSIESYFPKNKTVYPHQVEGVRAMLKFLHSKNAAVYNADEPGIGKTAQALLCRNILRELDISLPFQTLIVAPASACLTWEQEIKEWCDINPFLVNGLEKVKEIPRHKISVISYTSLALYIEKFKKLSFDMVIADESHLANNPKSKRTKAFFKVAANSTYKIFLSGTPFNKNIIDGYNIFSKISRGLFGTYEDFAERYSLKKIEEIYIPKFRKKIPITTYYGINEINAPELSKLIRGNFMVRRLKKDVLNLPDKMFKKIILEEKYKVPQFEKVNYEAVLKGLEDGSVTETNLPLHFMSLFKEQGTRKIPPIIEYIREMLEADIPVVVFGKHIDVMTKLAEEFASYQPAIIVGGVSAKDRHLAVDRFQTGQTNLFLGSFGAASTNITLTRSCNVVLTELSFNVTDIAQCIDRCNRIGSKSALTIHYFIVKDSVEVKVWDTLIQRARDFSNILNKQVA